MADNFDDRGARRIAYKTPLQVKDLTSGSIYEAKMLDYSDDGISFTSEVLFEKGTSLYFGILYPPDYFPSRVLEYYRGEVMWRKDVNQSPECHEYGVRLVSESIKQEANSDAAIALKESRQHPRRSFSRALRFGSPQKNYNGSTKNISASGVFIATNEKLEVGQQIKLNLPIKKGKMVRTVGQIVWINEEGFGLKFLEINGPGKNQQ